MDAKEVTLDAPQKDATPTMTTHHLIQLRNFDISSISHDQVVLVIGKRATGKTFLVKDLLYQHRDIPIGTCVSPNARIDRSLGDILPKIHDEYTHAIIENVLKRQRMMEEQKDEDPRMFLLLDNCIWNPTWTNNENVRFLFQNHSNVLFIITMPYAMGIPCTLQADIDYVFILRENVANNRRRIYEQYGNMFPSFEVFSKVMDQMDEYECLVIHNSASSNRIEDRVFWYKAKAHPEFRFGSHRDDKYDEEARNDIDTTV